MRVKILTKNFAKRVHPLVATTKLSSTFITSHFTPSNYNNLPSKIWRNRFTYPSSTIYSAFFSSFRSTNALKMGIPFTSRSATAPLTLADNLERPSLDNRSYRVILLDNQLEVLLIHDPDTDKVGAAMDVNVGSFSDSAHMPGIAHAVEHLLFMGTTKYPEENDYNRFLAANSGYSNASTASTSTNYFFEIASLNNNSSAANSPCSGISSNEDLSKFNEPPFYCALDRFAQFFICPLFLEDTVVRELKAVDSENKKNLQSDTWRLHQLSKSLSNPKHPYCKFSTGNFSTLHDEPLRRGVKIRNEFINFYKENDSANCMKLVILGQEALDTLERWTQELFAMIPNLNLKRNKWEDVSPYTEKQLLTLTCAKPVFNNCRLEIKFPYIDEELLYESQPAKYLCHLIGHEGPGSILAYIKAKGWATSLGAGPNVLCPGSSIFTISMRLTEDGLKNYVEVVKSVFYYIAMLNEQGPQEWIVNELSQIAKVDFKFKEKSPASSTTNWLSGVMQKPYPRDKLLSAPSLIISYDPKAIKDGLSCLNADNFLLTLTSQTYPGGWDKREKWYGTEYKHDKIPKDDIEEYKKAISSSLDDRPAELHLPHRNEFIPTRLEVDKKESNAPLKSPKLIRNENHMRMWFKKDDIFWVPKVNVHIEFRSPLLRISPRMTVIANLFQDLVRDALVEYSYDADISGLEYSISSDSIGIGVDVCGYNDKMPVLLEKVLLSMRDLEVKEDRFRIAKERHLRVLRNWDFQQPFSQIGTYCHWLTSDNSWINEQCLLELPSITSQNVRDFISQFMSLLHVEILAHGNCCREDALNISDLVERIIKTKELSPSLWPVRRTLIVPPGSNYVYQKILKDPENVNNCVEHILFAGYNDDRSLRAKLLMIAQIADEPAFDRLRTKEQLGYVVFSGATIHRMMIGYRILIQSEKSPVYLEGRIDRFLESLESLLLKMSDEEFESHKRSLSNKLLENLKYLSQETARFWKHILSEFYDFEQADHDVSHISALEKLDLIEFYKTSISPASMHRAKLSVHLKSQAGENLQTTEAGELRDMADSDMAESALMESDSKMSTALPPTVISDIRLFRSGLELSRGPRAVKDLCLFEELEPPL